MRNAPEEDEDDADTAQRGDEVDAFGQNVSKIVQQGNPWKTLKSKKEDDDTTILISALTCAQLKERLGDLGLKKI